MIATDARTAGYPPKPCAQTGQTPGSNERPEPPARHRLFGVDQAHGAQAGIADHGMTGDQATAVVTNYCDLVQFEQVDHASHRLDVLLDRHCRVSVEATGTSGRQVDEVTGHVVDQMGKELAEGCRADRPAVHEQDVRPRADTPVGGFPGPHVEQPIGLASEEVRCFAFGQCASDFLHRVVFGLGHLCSFCTNGSLPPIAARS